MSVTTRQASKSFADDLLSALSDDRIRQVFKELFTDIIKETVDNKFIQIDESIIKLNETITQQNKEICELKERENKLARKLNDLERYSRRNNLIISGLKTSSYAEAGAVGSTASTQASIKAVQDLCNRAFNINLELSDIAAAHRLPNRETNNGPAIPRTIIQFSNPKIRNDIYMAKRKLTESDGFKGIYISENLTELDNKLFSDARELKRKKLIKNTWTMNGQVYIKIGENDNPVRINNCLDLPHS